MSPYIYGLNGLNMQFSPSLLKNLIIALLAMWHVVSMFYHLLSILGQGFSFGAELKWL